MLVKAGIHATSVAELAWIPAFAEMTSLLRQPVRDDLAHHGRQGDAVEVAAGTQEQRSGSAQKVSVDSAGTSAR